MAVEVIALAFTDMTRSSAIPLASTIATPEVKERIVKKYADLRDKIVKEYVELMGAELANQLSKAFDNALHDEIYKALNTDNLASKFPKLAPKFWIRLALVLSDFDISRIILDKTTVERIRKFEEEMSYTLVKMLREADYEHVEKLVYGLSALVDRDLWILDTMMKYGFQGFIKKLKKRALIEAMEFTGYTTYLMFAWTASTVAVLGLAPQFKKENRDILAEWCRVYADELELYIDTLDILLKDEVYNELVKRGVIKE